MKKSLVNMISKVAISFCARMVQLESVKSPYANPYGRILYDCIMLEDTSGKIVYICEDSDGFRQVKTLLGLLPVKYTLDYKYN